MDILGLDLKLEGSPEEKDVKEDGKGGRRARDRDKQGGAEREKSEDITNEEDRPARRRRSTANRRYSPDTTPTMRQNSRPDESPTAAPSQPTTTRQSQTHSTTSHHYTVKHKTSLVNPGQMTGKPPTAFLKQMHERHNEEQKEQEETAEKAVDNKQKQTEKDQKTTNLIEPQQSPSQAKTVQNNVKPPSAVASTFKSPSTPAITRLTTTPAKTNSSKPTTMKEKKREATPPPEPLNVKRQRKSILNRFSPEVEAAAPRQERKPGNQLLLQSQSHTQAQQSKRVSTDTELISPSPILESPTLSVTLSEFGMILKARAEIAGAGNWIEYAFPRSWKEEATKAAKAKKSITESLKLSVSTASPSIAPPTPAAEATTSSTVTESASALPLSIDKPQDFHVSELLDGVLDLGLEPLGSNDSLAAQEKEKRSSSAAEEALIDTTMKSPLHTPKMEMAEAEKEKDEQEKAAMKRAEAKREQRRHKAAEKKKLEETLKQATLTEQRAQTTEMGLGKRVSKKTEKVKEWTEWIKTPEKTAKQTNNKDKRKSESLKKEGEVGSIASQPAKEPSKKPQKEVVLQSDSEADEDLLLYSPSGLRIPDEVGIAEKSSPPFEVAKRRDEDKDEQSIPETERLKGMKQENAAVKNVATSSPEKKQENEKEESNQADVVEGKKETTSAVKKTLPSPVPKVATTPVSTKPQPATIAGLTYIPPLTMKTRGRTRTQDSDTPDHTAPARFSPSPASPTPLSKPAAKPLHSSHRTPFGSSPAAHRAMIKLPRRIKLKVGNETSVIMTSQGSLQKSPIKSPAKQPSDSEKHEAEGKQSPVAGETGKAADEASVPHVGISMHKITHKTKKSAPKKELVNGVQRNYVPSLKPHLGQYRYPDGRVENLGMVINIVMDKMLLDVCQDGVLKHSRIMSEKEKKKRAIDYIKHCYNEKKKTGQVSNYYKQQKLLREKAIVPSLSERRQRRKIVNSLEKNDDFVMIPLKREKKEAIPQSQLQTMPARSRSIRSSTPQSAIAEQNQSERKENAHWRVHQALSNYFNDDMQDVTKNENSLNTSDVYTYGDDDYIPPPYPRQRSFASYERRASLSTAAATALPLTPSIELPVQGDYDFDYVQPAMGGEGSVDMEEEQGPASVEMRARGGRDTEGSLRHKKERKKKHSKPLIALTDYISSRFGFENGADIERQLLPSRLHAFDSSIDPFYSEILPDASQYYDSSCSVSKGEEYGDDLDVGSAEGAGAWTGVPEIETSLQLSTAKRAADEIEKVILRPCNYDGTEASIEDIIFNKAFEEPTERRSLLTNVIDLISEQYLAETSAQGRQDEPVVLYNTTLRNANQLRDYYFTFSYDRQQAANWVHRFIVENLPVHLLSAYLALLRYCRSMTGSYVMSVVRSAGGSSAPIDWQTATRLIQEYVTLKVCDPELDDLNRTVQSNILSDVVFVLASPVMSVGDYTNKVKAHEHMFRWLKQLGHPDSEVVKLEIDEDRMSVPLLCDAYMAALLHVIRKKVKEHRGQRVVLVGFGTTCYLCHRAVQLTHGVSAIIDLAFPLFTEEGPRGTPDDDICLTYCPSLFVMGSDAEDFDPFALKDLRDNLLSPSGLLVVCNADKELYVRTSTLLRTKLTQRLVQRAVVDEVCSFLQLECTRKERSQLMPYDLNDVLTVEDYLLQEPITASHSSTQQTVDGINGNELPSMGSDGEKVVERQRKSVGASGLATTLGLGLQQRRLTVTGNEDWDGHPPAKKKAYRTTSNESNSLSQTALLSQRAAAWQHQSSQYNTTPSGTYPLSPSSFHSPSIAHSSHPHVYTSSSYPHPHPPSALSPAPLPSHHPPPPLYPSNFSIPSTLRPLDDARNRLDTLLSKF